MKKTIPSAVSCMDDNDSKASDNKDSEEGRGKKKKMKSTKSSAFQQPVEDAAITTQQTNASDNKDSEEGRRKKKRKSTKSSAVQQPVEDAAITTQQYSEEGRRKKKRKSTKSSAVQQSVEDVAITTQQTKTSGNKDSEGGRKKRKSTKSLTVQQPVEDVAITTQQTKASNNKDSEGRRKKNIKSSAVQQLVEDIAITTQQTEASYNKYREEGRRKKKSTKSLSIQQPVEYVAITTQTKASYHKDSEGRRKKKMKGANTHNIRKCYFPHTCGNKSLEVQQSVEDVAITTQRSLFATNPTPILRKKKEEATSNGDNNIDEKRREKKARIKRATLRPIDQRIGAYKRVPDDPTHRWKPPPSPHNLLQEKYYEDPWKVLIICILCNRTKGQEAGKVLEALFAECSSPEETTKVPTEKIECIIRELGLQKRRARTIKRLAEEYLKNWEYVTQLHGIGKYAADAYAIFCSGRWQEVKPVDQKLELYWNFLNEVGPKQEVLGTI